MAKLVNNLFKDSEPQPKVEKVKEKKYIKLKIDSPKEEYAVMLQRIAKGELRWAFFGVENDKEYQFYEVLK